MLNFFFICIYCILLANAGVMHSHTHEINRERQKDGSFSPRDSEHFQKDGEHNTEFDHEAILGSHAEAEEFDQLPPKEAKARLAKLLKIMDINSDGSISPRELKAWIMRSLRKLSEEEAEERFDDVDHNGDGNISWDEFISDAYGSDEDENGSSHLISDDKTIWKAADKNNNGRLSRSEWAVFNHPEEYPEMLPIFLDQTLRDRDTNKDRLIDFQEFVGERASQHDKQWLTEQKVVFDEHDKDHDGTLGGVEILSWIIPSNEEIAEEEVIHLFAASDDDHDHMLTFEEILSHYDIFVGSEATDYGEHLLHAPHLNDEL